MFEATVREEVCRLRRPGTRWLSTGHDGGESRADAAYLVSVPEGWDDVDVAGYVARRRRAAGFAGAPDAPLDAAPALLTGVSMRHAHRARLGPAEAVVTAGLSNPAALPVPDESDGDDARGGTLDADGDDRDDRDDERHIGTVNVVIGTTRSLAPGALANLVAVAAEAKAATLLPGTGVPGTTSDAVLAACDPAGERAAFSGSATAVGSAARACVRDALLAALESRYDSEDPPKSVVAAEYGTVTDRRAAVESINVDSEGG
ncbi:adenosylcobinamide amidohydrolase [Halobellus rubicundus]|uniref:Adenosylcobinamide amidohydrolase n=1 Tax=Halobellus rubicundus TaxID=2996466 RepID=A0ABD5MG89_9EURY